MTATIKPGNSDTITVAQGDFIVLQNSASGKARIELASGSKKGRIIVDAHKGHATYGPFDAGSVTVGAVVGSLSYAYGARPAIASDGATQSSGALSGLLYEGDSLAAHGYFEGNPTCTAVGGVGSVLMTASVPQVGGQIKIGNVTNDIRWNGFHDVLAASGNTATIAVPTDIAATATTTRSQITASLPHQRSASGAHNWAEWIDGKVYPLTANLAIGGRVLTEIVADFYTQGPGLYRNMLVDFDGGTNDPKNAIDPAVSAAAYEAFVSNCRDCGHRVICNTVPALYGAANTADTQQKTLQLNKEIRRIAVQYGMELVDRYALLQDPATAAILVANVDTADNIHLTPAAAKILGAAKALIYAKYLPTRSVNLPATTSDTIGTITTSNNIIDGFFAGTGGSGGAGSIATGWTLAPTTMTVTGSKGTGTVGATQILTLSGSAGSFTFTGANVAASVVPGGTYEFVGKISLANFADSSFRMTMELIPTMTRPGMSSFVGSVRACFCRLTTTAFPLGDNALTLRTEPITIPSDATVTGFQLRLTGVKAGAPGGTETVTLENWALRRIT